MIELNVHFLKDKRVQLQWCAFVYGSRSNGRDGEASDMKRLLVNYNFVELKNKFEMTAFDRIICVHAKIFATGIPVSHAKESEHRINIVSNVL